MSDERRIKDVQCPQCGKEFTLRWNGEEDTGKRRLLASRAGIAAIDLVLPVYRDVPVTLLLGISDGEPYYATISCPHCDYEEEL